MFQVAGYSISALVTDYFALDGGAMFGSVPKTLWNRLIPSDDRNRIPLACRLLVLEGQGRKILVDAGMGRAWSDKEREIYAIDHRTSVLSKAVLGVTDVILTHLHFDHAAGINEEGRLAFPHATYYVSETNLNRGRHPGVRERASYLPQNILPLENAQMHVCADGEEILPGITVEQFHGHTAGMQMIRVGTGNGAMVYPSDLMPTAHHIPAAYVMGYDLHAERSVDEKTAFLATAVQEQYVVVFEHDRDTAAGRIGIDEKGRYHLADRVEIPAYSLDG